eukprot:GDKI01021899.1.p1 GENE.GDKI01021899.1~~GDKI01021899.1.p1  ORF type:complete len:119 (+),score=12.50 GDKI01021899.1:169-525(+)
MHSMQHPPNTAHDFLYTHTHCSRVAPPRSEGVCRKLFSIVAATLMFYLHTPPRPSHGGHLSTSAVNDAPAPPLTVSTSLKVKVTNQMLPSPRVLGLTIGARDGGVAELEQRVVIKRIE